MMYASEDLLNEHEGILFGMEILEEMAKRVNGSGKVETSDVAEMVNFFRLFADKCHHGKEEGLMFPTMERVGIPNEDGPIGQMLTEHNEGRRYIALMGSSVENSTFDGSKFVEAAEGYITLMRAHINKENGILFPLGDKAIPMEEQKQLLEKFEEFEEEVMGKGTHEKLHRLLGSLKAKYLQ